MLGGQLRRLAVLGDAELALAGDLPFALDDGDLVLLHEPLDAHVELPRHLAAAVDDLGAIEPRLLRDEAVGGGMRQIMIDLGRAKRRLGRTAPPVATDPAHLLPLLAGGLL